MPKPLLVAASCARASSLLTLATPLSSPRVGGAVATLGEKNPPVLGDDQPRLAQREVQLVADFASGQIDVIETIRKLLDQANAHTALK
jgi:hypothetical protein